jgi:hypothetical protein
LARCREVCCRNDAHVSREQLLNFNGFC